MLDLLIKNGKIVDGTGNPYFYGDVGIQGEEIAKIGGIEEEAKRVIDATGRVISPGFCDMHNHSDGDVFAFPSMDWFALQGVTTGLTGHCGFGAPNSKICKEYFSGGFLSEEEQERYGDWDSIKEMAQRGDQVGGLGINIAHLVGSGALRYSVMGPENIKPTKEQMLKMKKVMEKCMQDGAIGMSTGFSYRPGRFFTTEELIEVAEVVKQYDGIMVMHIRGHHCQEAYRQGLKEVIEVQKKVGIPIHVSHLSAYVGMFLEEDEVYPINRKMLEDARREGVDVTFDVLAYGSDSFGVSFYVGGVPAAFGMSFEEFGKAWKDPEFREKVWKSASTVDDYCVCDYTEAVVCNPLNLVFNTGDADIDGKTLGTLTKSRRESFDFIMNLFLQKSPAFVVYFNQSQSEVGRLSESRLTMPSSDAAYTWDGPALSGVMPKFFRDHIDKGFCLEEVIRRMCAGNARIRLFDRGLLRAGMKADICVFDADHFKPSGTWGNPRVKPSGMDFVLVNGSVVVDNGEMTDARPGKVVLKR
jgi:N-acyl-D-amino-acid deacylase